VQDARAAQKPTHTITLGHEKLKEQATTMVLNQEFLGGKRGGVEKIGMHGVEVDVEVELGCGCGCGGDRVANRWRIGGKSWKIFGSRQPINTMSTMTMAI